MSSCIRLSSILELDGIIDIEASTDMAQTGFQFDGSPQEKEHWQIREEGLLKIGTHDVCTVDAIPLTAQQLMDEATPPKRRLMIIPKKGQGSKMALYANYCTGPLLVTVDLIDTHIQRLTHRVRVLIWQHSQQHGAQNGYTLEDLVAKTRRLSAQPGAIVDGNIQHLTYQNLVRIVSVEGDGLDESEAELLDEDEENDFGYDDELEEGLQENAEKGSDLETLLKQYGAARQVVNKAVCLDQITTTWVNSLLQLAECGFLISNLETPSDRALLSTTSLRCQITAFTKCRTKADRVEAAHLFGSLLFRDFCMEISQATQVEQDVGADGFEADASARFFLPQKPPSTLSMEQPLFAPIAFGCNLSKLEDQEAILDDIWEDRERSLRSPQEDVSKAPELLTIAVTFWRKQVGALKEKRKRKHEKNKARKKPRVK